MKGVVWFTIIFLAMISFGVMVLPSQVMAGTSFSIRVDAYPISFSFSDNQPERVYVEREVTHYHYPNFRSNHNVPRYRHDYPGRGYDRSPYRHHGRYTDRTRWYHR